MEETAALVARAQKGDQDAFNELYHRTRDRAYFVAYSITRSEDDALDILQSAYLKAWQELKKLKEPERFGAWLQSITANTAKNTLRKSKPQLTWSGGRDDVDPVTLLTERDEAYIPDAAMDTAETRRLIQGIVDALPEDQRLTVLMFYYDDMSPEEIAGALQVPRGTVLSRLYYARKKISAGVEALETSQGTKLYGAAPIPLFAWLLKNLARESAVALPPAVLAGSASAGGGILAALTLPKFIAALAAAGVAVGGAAAAATIVRRTQTQPVFAETVLSTAAEMRSAATVEALSFSLPSLPILTEKASSSSLQSIPHTTAVAGVPKAVASRAVQTTAPPAATTGRAASTTGYVYTAPATARATTTAITTASTSTTTTTPPPATQPPGPQKITKTSSGVILEYMSDVLPPGMVFQVTQGGGGAGFTARVINRAPGGGLVSQLVITCTLNGEPVHAVPGTVTLRLPIPESVPAADYGQLEVQHRTAGGAAPPVDAVRVENGYLVFETDYI